MSADVEAQAKDYLGSRDDIPETRTVATRDRIRGKMNADIEAFLKSGGSINEVQSNVMADPPRKPSSEYGSQPI